MVLLHVHAGDDCPPAYRGYLLAAHSGDDPRLQNLRLPDLLQLPSQYSDEEVARGAKSRQVDQSLVQECGRPVLWLPVLLHHQFDELGNLAALFGIHNYDSSVV